MKVLKRGPLGAVGTVRSLVSVIKDIDFDDVRDRAERRPDILIIGDTGDRALVAASRLFGETDRQGVTTEAWNDRTTLDTSRSDVIIVYDPDGKGLFDRVRKAAGRQDDTTIFFFADSLDGSDPVSTIRAEIMDEIPDLAPAIGRHFAAWRPAAVKTIIDQTSRANAQFALVSNIPAVIPFLGGLASASADLLVLTKNQMMMCYKIAAAHERPLGDHMALIWELVPVIGAGYAWRTAAREAASFIPFAAGTIPKVAIAFAGTMTMGKAADYFYNTGNAPGKSQLRMFRKQAEKLFHSLPFIDDYQTPATGKPTVEISQADNEH